MVVPSTATTPAPESGKGKGKGNSHADADAGAVEVARMKVIDMVHALLPSEEWAGWERLGWEETPSHHRGRGKAHRRAASDVARGSPALGDEEGEQDGEEEDDEDEDEEEEPGYLFPNRTPASAQAIADRRRTIRSKSFSHPSRSTHPSNWTSTSFPTRQPLTRVKTEPTTSRFAESREAHLLGAEEEAVPYLGELGEEEAKELLEHPSLADTKLTMLVAPSHLGPTALEALETSDDGNRLITYEELPIHWRNNEHIFTG
jgi:adiponectin receptor